MSSHQVAVVGLCLAALAVRAVPWVAVAAGVLDRATTVLPAGRHRPGSLGGADLDVVASAVDRARRVTRAATWGLGASATAAAVVVAGSGHGGLLLVGCLGLLLASVDSDREPGLRTARWGTGGAVLVGGWLSAVAHLPGALPVVLTLALSLVLTLAVAAVHAHVVTPVAPARPGDVSADAVGGRGRHAVARVRSVAEVLAYAAVPALVACALGVLPTPWGLP